jgi:hypothetical protein
MRARIEIFGPSAAIFALLVTSFALAESSDAGVHVADAGPVDVVLPIAARAQAPESPPSGWCGETAIQEGLLHLGIWAPQKTINRAGRPSHPDLYSSEIPGALSAFGVRFTMYAGGTGYAAFVKWTQAAIDAGDPVLAGVKILPTAHPEWGLDHFVLAVGYGERGLLVNTTWGHREWVGDELAKGLSFHHAVYGIRILGRKLPTSRATAARLTFLGEREGDAGAAHTTLRVSCTGDASAPVREIGSTIERLREPEISVPSDAVARFHCAPTE